MHTGQTTVDGEPCDHQNQFSCSAPCTEGDFFIIFFTDNAKYCHQYYLYGMAAIVDLRHKSLEWLKPHQHHSIKQQLLSVMFAVAGISVDVMSEDDENNEEMAALPQSKYPRFDDCDFLDARDEEQSAALGYNSVSHP